MRRAVRRGVVLLVIAAALGGGGTDAGAAQAPVAHDKEFWRAIIKNGHAVPDGAALPALLGELSQALGSPDAELRDEIGYTILTAWIYRNRTVPVELRRLVIADLTANLKKGIGERDTDGVFLRSFSALTLGVLAALDVEAPYLTPTEFNTLFDAAIAYARDEQDLRGFDPKKGWMHSAAHTADLLKFLGRGRYLQQAQQARLLTAIGDKLSRAGIAFTHGEEERLARAALSIAARPDFDEVSFRQWTTGLVTPTPGATTAMSIASVENRKHVLVSLFALLSTDTRELPSLRKAHAIVLAALRG